MWHYIFKIAAVYLGAVLTGITIVAIFVVLLVWSSSHAHADEDYDWEAYHNAPVQHVPDIWEFEMLMVTLGATPQEERDRKELWRCEKAIADYKSGLIVLETFTPEGESVYEWYADTIAKDQEKVRIACDPVKDRMHEMEDHDAD